MTLMLRFRDLTVPLGATVPRHREVIANEGVVMWGWLMRQSEQVPSELLNHLANSIRMNKQNDIFLYDSGTCNLRRATLIGLSAFPEGMRIPTPEPRKTPVYMSEAMCPVWFHLASIAEEPLDLKHLKLTGMPTLLRPRESDFAKIGTEVSIESFREMGPTLWEVDLSS
jgi:hypothetical protein